MMYLKLTEQMPFGKYKQYCLGRIKQIYPSYFKWLIDKRIVSIVEEPKPDFEFRKLLNEIFLWK